MQPLFLGITKYVYFELFIALGLGIVGLPIPDETLMAFAGFLVYQGKLDYLVTIGVAFSGTSCGITIGYGLGRAFGHPSVRKYAAKMRMSADDIRTAERLYNKYGKVVLFFGYFLPAVRHLTAVFAGAALMPYRTFALFAYAGGFVWTAILVSLGFFLGERWHQVSLYSNRFMIPLMLLAVIAFLIGAYWKKTRRG